MLGNYGVQRASHSLLDVSRHPQEINVSAHRESAASTTQGLSSQNPLAADSTRNPFRTLILVVPKNVADHGSRGRRWFSKVDRPPRLDRASDGSLGFALNAL